MRRTGSGPRAPRAALLAALSAVATAASHPPAAAGEPAAAPPPAAVAAVPARSTVLFRDVAVIPMTAPGRVDPGRDVLVEDGRIARVGVGRSLRAPRGATVVDGRGRFLAPGLAEMHAHVPSPRPDAARDEAQERWARDVLLLYVAHGVTTIRGMLGHPWHLELRGRLARGEVLGPRLYTAGPSLNGNSAPDPATAERLVRAHAAAGYDFLKLHPGLTVPVFDAIVATAREVGIAFEGHVAEAVGVERALAARQRAIDHLDGYVHALADPACLRGPTSGGFFGIGLVHCVDESRIPALVARTKAAGTWMAPTQILLEQWAFAPTEAELRARPAVRFLPPAVLDGWQKARTGNLALQSVDPERARRFVDVRRQLIGAMHRAGVPIVLASDAPQVFNVPGDSALAELGTYVASGLTPYEALATGTVNAARFFGAADRRGTVEAGRDADLVLYAANPLEDVANARRIEGVMVDGRWLPRADLDARLEELARRVAAR